ncbi:MAG: cupin domain-containing protein [Acidiferrobacterales bacterium]|nr:cupin domain-containing protein [Acidiferrobacterales bacterium]
MTIFSDIDQQDFLAKYWQQKPLVFKQSFAHLKDLVDGNDLAGLACAEGVETRIITGHKIDGNWTCQHGPFNEQTFTSLDAQDWTLLVQGVDQWDDEIKQILKQFTFLPSWRLEDIMASYAPVGGGVGPHFDYYDVFLIQISGRREWQIGQACDHNTELQSNDQVKLLEQFECIDTHTLKAGDMIYIPAGIAHWGTSLSDDCITFSIGFRAPSEKELLIETLEHLIQHFESKTEDNNHYQDTLDSIDQNPFKINHAAHQQISSSIEKITPELFTQSLQLAFGKLVTDPRYSPFDDEPEKHWADSDLKTLFTNQSKIDIEHSINSRFAFSETHLFVNGEAFEANSSFSQALCEKQVIKPITQSEIDILVSLFNQQYIRV